MNSNKLHYKMYKAGSKWVFASIVTVTLGIGIVPLTRANASSTDTAALSTSDASSTSSTSDASSTSSTSDASSTSSTSDASSTSSTSDASSTSSTSDASSTSSTSDASSTSSTSDASSTSSTSDASSTSSTSDASSISSTSDASSTSSTSDASSTSSTSDASSTSSTSSATQKVVTNSLAANVATVGKTNVDKDNFLDYFTQNGSATNNYDSETGVQNLTTGSWQTGNVAFDGATNLNYDFEIDGAINLGNATSTAGYSGVADGIGFVFYQGERNQVGGTGGDLGIYGVTNAFGWKVDTWLNDTAHSNQKLDGDYDDGHTNPYGAFITTNSAGYGTIDNATAVNINKSIEDGKFHDVKFIYTAATKTLEIILSTPDGDITFSKVFDFDSSNPGYYFTIASSTGNLPTKQAFRIDSLSYTPIQKATITYIDDTTGKTLSTDSVTGPSLSVINYSTDASIKNYENQGYTLVSNGFSQGTEYDDDDTVDQSFEVHLTHATIPVNPSNPETPGQPINPNDPNGPVWPDGTDEDSLTKTVTETIHYVYEDGTKAAPDKTDSVTFNHEIIIDKVTGEIIKDNGWTALNNDTTFDEVNSPIIKGYTPDQTSISEITGLTKDSDNVVKTVVYKQNEGTVNVTYIDDTTGKTLSTKSLSGGSGDKVNYITADTIKSYEDQGYKLVSDNYPVNGVNFNDGTQSFEVHLVYVGKPTPATPQTPTNTNGSNVVIPKAMNNVVSKKTVVPAAVTPTKASLPQTGDEQNTRNSIIGAILVALAAVGTLFGIGKRNKKQSK